MMTNDDWDLLVSFLPANWRQLAFATNAMKGLRKDKSEENLLRILLMHFACGYSLRETAVRARKAHLAELSDVALLKRLRKCKQWFYSLCVEMFTDRGLMLNEDKFQVRLFDATNVKEPGQTGSLWRIHYSVQIPSLRCDFFKVTETEGEGTGESFMHFPIQKGDYIIADRGYSAASGIEFADSRKAFIAVRLNYHTLPLFDCNKTRFPILSHLRELKKTGSVSEWPVCIQAPNGAYIDCRVCAIRKSKEAIEIAHKKLRRRASKKGHVLKKDTLDYAEYVTILTTFPEQKFSPAEVLEWYRIRWQVELVFKRFKQICNLGHLPKHNDDSALAWLYGKLFVALLTEKLITHAESISPWGYLMELPPAAKSLA